MPLFKQGDFYGGINAGIDQVLRVVDGEALPAPDKSWKPRSSNAPWPMLIFLLMFLGGGVLRTFGRLGGATILGGIGAVVGWSVTMLWPVALLGFVVLFVVGLLFGGKTGMGRGGRVYRDRRGGGWGGTRWSLRSWRAGCCTRCP